MQRGAAHEQRNEDGTEAHTIRVSDIQSRPSWPVLVSEMNFARGETLSVATKTCVSVCTLAINLSTFGCRMVFRRRTKLQRTGRMDG